MDKPVLSENQKKVIELVTAGKNYPQIEMTLGYSNGYVKLLMNRLFSAFDASNKSHLIHILEEKGYFE